MTEFGALFREQVLKNVEHGLFYSYKTNLVNRRCEIIRENNKLLKKNNRGFNFKGKEYFTFGYGSTWEETSNVHPNLLSKVEKFVLDIEHSEKIKANINSYIINILNACNSVADLYILAPKQLHKYFPNISHGNYMSKKTLTIEDITAFKEHTQSSKQYLKEQLLLNILLKK